MRVDLGSGATTPLIPLFIGSNALAVDRGGAAYLVGYVGERGAVVSEKHDLVRVEPTGKATRVAVDFLAPRPNKSCRIGLLVDDTSVYGVQSCVAGPTEIVQVPKSGGSAKIIAANSGEADVNGVAQNETELFYAAEKTIMRLPKAGGSTKPLVAYEGPITALAIRGNDVWFTERAIEMSNGKASVTLYLSRVALDGTKATRVAVLPPLLPTNFVRAVSVLSTKDGVYVNVQDSGDKAVRWTHRLLRVTP